MKNLLVVILADIVMRVTVFGLGMLTCMIGLIAPETMMDALKKSFNED